jgi:hypothetical protein
LQKNPIAVDLRREQRALAIENHPLSAVKSSAKPLIWKERTKPREDLRMTDERREILLFADYT